MLYYIIFSFYVRLQNEVLNCNFPTKVLKEHSFFLMFINFCPLLSSFAKLRKGSSYLSVIPPICPHGTTRLPLYGFSWNLIFEHLPKSVDIFQVFLKSDKIKECFIWRPIYIVEWEMFQTNCRENQNGHFVCNNIFSKILPFMR
jgi:hypothetical protein